jgi:Flp pilus assembly protein TadD
MSQVTLAQAMEIAIEHHRAGRLVEAESVYRQILAQQPNHPDAIHLFGVLANQAGRADIAIEQIQRAIKLNPSVAEYHLNIGEVYRRVGKFDESIAHTRRAIELRPDLFEGYCNLAIAYSDKRFLADANEALLRALALRPDDIGVLINIGSNYWETDQNEKALEYFQRAIAVRPDCVDAHWSAARVLLQFGRFQEGLEEFEWRLQYPKMRLNRGFTQPQWDGSDLTGKTILLHTEGGHGDAINFIRLVPQVAARGGKIVLECQPSLIPLFRDFPGISEIVARGDTLPPFDVHIPLQGLLRILKINLDNIPNKVPYLTAPKDRLDKWSARMPQDEMLRVGLVWCGVMYAETDYRPRSLETFHPFLKFPNMHFFSLQKGEAASEKPPAGTDWFDFSADIQDFADTAALIQNLDIVISVDTSVAHLSGALAKPTWVLIPSQSDFRWLLNRTDSPWYPTMRLFRQPRNVPWPVIIKQITPELAKFQRPHS